MFLTNYFYNEKWTAERAAKIRPLKKRLVMDDAFNNMINVDIRYEKAVMRERCMGEEFVELAVGRCKVGIISGMRQLCHFWHDHGNDCSKCLNYTEV
jgi:hypothetical protein